MIIREFFETRSDGVNLYKTYSDNGYMILQVETGTMYADAIDIEDTNYTYEETDVLIEAEEVEEVIEIEEKEEVTEETEEIEDEVEEVEVETEEVEPAEETPLFEEVETIERTR